MDDSDKPKMFRTLRGFLDGQEADGPNYFYTSRGREWDIVPARSASKGNSR